MIRTSASALTFGTLTVLFAAPAFAQTSIDVTAQTDVEAGFSATPLVRPLDAVRARAQEIKENALRPSASVTPSSLPAPLRLEARPISARVVETATSTPRGSFTAVVRTHVGGIKNRLENTLRYLSRFLTRVESRLEKMEAAGVDVAGITSLLANAEATIAVAGEDVAAIGTSVGSDDDRTTIRAQISADVRAAQESIRLAHEAVRSVVTALVATARDTSADVQVEAAVEIE